MLTSSRSLFLLVCFVTLLLLVTLAGFAYIFFITTWEPATKVVSVLMYCFICSLVLNWVHMNKLRTLSFQVRTKGQGSPEMFSDLYQNSPVPYVRTDKTGKVIHVNAAAVRLFQLTVEELSGQSLYTLVNDAAVAGTAKAFSIQEHITAGQFVNDAEVTYVTKDGQHHWGLLSAFPYEHNTERLITLIDTTEAKAIDVAKTEFVSLASHQLRTPISSLLWNLELLTAILADAPDEQRQYLNKIHRSGKKMNALVNDFLDATKLEMGTFATKSEQVPLNQFLNQIVEEFEAQIVAKSLTVHTNYLPTEVTVSTDPALLHIIISNLISNSIKYTPTEGQVMVSIVAVREGIQFRIQDTGIGIPTADQSHMFSKLYRATNTKTSPTEGTGLGLYVVKQAVSLLGGTIAFVSKEGVGTEFLVTVPFRQ